MRTQLPSTQSLRVFEVVARYLNCTHAAQELCLTASAVSKQLQSLEDTLGVELFLRGRHGLTLTGAGQVYLDSIKPLMIKLVEAGERVNGAQPLAQDLHLRVPPAFADRWLLPRFAEFSGANPDVRIHLDASAMRDENLLVTYDLYVRFGRGSWPGCVADYLCGRHMVIVASPGLLRREPPLRAPADLLRHTLFEHSWVPMGWAQAFENLGVKPERAPAIVQWDFYSVIIRSACVGHGLSLVPRCFVAEELAKGELVQVLDYSHCNDFGYYLVFAEGRAADPGIARFRDWLRSCRSAGEDPPEPVATRKR
jgi:LysR family glycine cleavage system transcriptional activator